MPESRSETAPQRSLAGRGPKPRAARAASRDLRRKADTAGDALANLAAAGETPSGSDRVLTQAFSRLERLGTALRRASEELAAERRRTDALREEVRRLRREVPGGRRIPSAN